MSYMVIHREASPMKLDEICEFRGGGTPSKSNPEYWSGSIPWVSPKDVKSLIITDSIDHISERAVKESTTSIIPKGAVLLVVRSGILANSIPLTIAGRDLAINQDIKALCPRSIVESRYLYYLLLGHSPALRRMVGRGATVHRLLAEELRSLTFLIPAKSEQRRIVGILDEAFAGIATAKANTEQNLRNARAVFESSLDSVFTQRGAGWVEKPFRDVCDVKHGFAFKSRFFVDSGEHVVLTPGNFFESGGYRGRGEKTKYYCGEIPNGYVLHEGDMLVAMTEQAAGLLGSPILVPESGRFLHNQRLGLVIKRPGVPWINEFFFHVFNTARVRKEIHDSATGVKVRHTSPSKIGDVRVWFPPSVSEQRAIVHTLSHIRIETERIAAITRAKLAALDELRQSLLHRAFAGEL